MSEAVRTAEASDIDKCVALAFDMIAEGYYKEYDRRHDGARKTNIRAARLVVYGLRKGR